MESVRADSVGTNATDGFIVVRGRQLSGVDPLSLLAESRTKERPWIVWNGPDERVTALGSACALTASGPDRFSEIRRRASERFAGRDVDPALPSFATPRFFGGFAFHHGETVRHGEPDWRGFPDAGFVLPAVSLIERDGQQWLTAAAIGPEATATAEAALDRWTAALGERSTSADGQPPGITDRTQFPARAAWTGQVQTALGSVERGDLQKVVLAGAQRVDLAGPVSVPTALERLGSRYPDCYRFAFRPDAREVGTFFGATPERLVALSGREVKTAALAGSIGRGDTRAEDEWLAERLASSEKDSHEHALVVDAIRDQLTGAADAVETGDRSIRQLAAVQHLRTPIRATLSEDVHVLSLVAALHPTPAVGGLPPDEALDAIRNAEAFDRGWYAAPIGWFDANGDGTFAVGIRSALTHKQRATLFAGAGIVADSDPDEEWDEIQLKYRPMLDALR